MKQIKIAPSIMCADFGDMRQAILDIQDGGADMLHFDVMDGIFVPNLTFGTKMIADLKKHATVPIDVHLMIGRPERMIAAFAQAGADIISLHVESTDKHYIIPILKDIRRHKCQAGIVVSPDTAIPSIRDYLDYCDMVTLMSVYPGASGQKFIEKSYDRLTQLNNLIGNRKIDLKIDGGITLENVAKVKELGANIIVAGNTIFASDDWKNIIRQLRDNPDIVEECQDSEDDDEDDCSEDEE